VQASALRLPFKTSSVDEVIASNPFIPGGQGAIDFLPEAAKVAKPDAEIILNFTKRNPFGSKLPSQDVLKQLNLEIVQEAGPLLPRFNDQVFRFTDGRIIPNDKVLTTILKKTQ
jgi:hypothetical protein